jgi:hypothetical protein
MGRQEFLTLGKFYEVKKVLSTLIYQLEIFLPNDEKYLFIGITLAF